MSILLFLVTFLHAQEKSAFEQSMEHDTALPSQESWVEIKNVRFRKYEMSNGLYYIKFKNADAATAELFCEPPAGYKSEHLVIEQPVMEKRSRAFVQVFHEKCSGTVKKADIKLDPATGLTFPREQKAKD